uniref:Small nuclear ribonucleoprotein E n=1 Tax=Rhizochromulina marina TaxID=1034831 RepID=A0A6U0Y1E1_9STRA|eukprot:CAMPEP_0118971064 /NCGR_PEP_ID=MMETSP1173-20130426/7808_1 /TAXON_ID=1034831 /ORGANISM="Rhizochromulina marina cf, Strain CCMP1243" /LENGTH=97 /DNA_ID=CAMNT_0006920493 /DNA_START=41 /DNA_END=334 /DNA_ORIENTATION=-
MSGYGPGGGSTRVKKVMTQPINLIFRFLQNRTRILIWLYENSNTMIEGRIVGFDEYMNLVLDDAQEIDQKQETRTDLGRILLKGDTITLMQEAQAAA